jgi:ATP-dependent DNA helicase RecG
VQFLKGVGPRRAERLGRLGLHTARDVLFFFPRDYQDLTDLRPIKQLEEGPLLSVLGEVVEINLRSIGPGRTLLAVEIMQDSDLLRAVWFNQPFMEKRYHQGQQLLVSGKALQRAGTWEMTHPHVEVIEQDDGEAEGRLLPVYPSTEGVRQGHLRRMVRAVLEECGESVEEIFPEKFRAEHGLLPLGEALAQIHFPGDRQSLAEARRRLVYQELLLLQLGLGLRRAIRAEQATAPSLEATAKIDARIRRRFPFKLTEGQDTAVREITADMMKSCPMNRLLQGDVGSGKTVIALYATLLAVAHGYQVAIMAPTEVLARQHARVLGEFLEASRVRAALLVGSLTRSQRELVLTELGRGDLDVVIGTHALVQPDIQFERLGLVIIDEQHKFGVRQRAELKDSGPHYLVMTATPIPRTLTMTIFGDLDLSTMRDFPPGRQPIHTYLGTAEQRDKWWQFFRKQLDEGRQGFVIAPLIEESETWDVASLSQVYEELVNGPLADYQLATVHGRMSGREKDAVMKDFYTGRIQVLVSTTVVEVGIDVPNASLMTIEGAERFGLAQLHQLRGRIGRGKYPGYCTLFADLEKEDTRKRLEAFAETSDGFELAELDFSMRGPGDLFGTRQHGMPPLRIADLIRDAKMVKLARHDAEQLLAADPGMADPEHALLRERVLLRYGAVLCLGDVG